MKVDLHKTMSVKSLSAGLGANLKISVVRENTMVTRKFETTVFCINQRDPLVRVLTLKSGQIINDETFKLDYSGAGYPNTRAFEMSQEGVIFRLSEEDPIFNEKYDLFPVYHLSIIDFLLRTLGTDYQNGPDTVAEYVTLGRSSFPPRFLFSSNSMGDSESDPGCFLIEATGDNYVDTRLIRMCLKEADIESLGIAERYGDFGFNSAFPRKNPIAAVNHGDFIGIWKWKPTDCSSEKDGNYQEIPAELVEVIFFERENEKTPETEGIIDQVLCLGEKGETLVYSSSGVAALHTIGGGFKDYKIQCREPVTNATMDAGETVLAILSANELTVVDLKSPDRRYTEKLERTNNLSRIEIIDTKFGPALVLSDGEQFWMYEIENVLGDESSLRLKLLANDEGSAFHFSKFGEAMLVVSQTSISIYRLRPEVQSVSPKEIELSSTQQKAIDYVAHWKFLLEFGSDSELEAHLELSVDFNTERTDLLDELLVLCAEAYRSRGAELTIKAGANPFSLVSSDGLSPLNLACCNNDADTVGAMLKFDSGFTNEERAELTRLQGVSERWSAEFEKKFYAEIGSGLDHAYPVGEMIVQIHSRSMRAAVEEAQVLRQALSEAASRS